MEIGVSTVRQLRPEPVRERHDHPAHRLDRIRSLPRQCTMRRPAKRRHSRARKPLFPETDLITRLLPDNNEIRRNQSLVYQQSSPGRPTNLLIRHCRDNESPTQRHASTCQRHARHNLGRHARLVIASTPAIDTAINEIRGKRTVRPGRKIARWHDIHVSVQAQNRSPVRADFGDEIRLLWLELGNPDGKAFLPQRLRADRNGLAHISRGIDRRNLDEPAQQRDRLLLIDVSHHTPGYL